MQEIFLSSLWRSPAVTILHINACLKLQVSKLLIIYYSTSYCITNRKIQILRNAIQSQVVVHHLQTYLFGHATGKELAEKIIAAVQENGIPLGKLQMLESDGPNVSKTVWNIINDSLSLPYRSHGLY